MSKYSQLPRNTITLLTMRAQWKVDVQDYVNWAVGALVDGFDSRSLAILAGLDYGIVSQTEAPDYFLQAVKELALPIPDCELAVGNWYKTESSYRKLGLSLPDEETLLGQHLVELAEQIKEGVIDPVIGLDRIYHEIVFAYRYGLRETDTWKLDKRAGSGSKKRWDAAGLWAWEDYIIYDNYAIRYEKLETDQVKQEIIAFATDWLENPEASFAPKYAIYKPLPEAEKKIPVQVKPTQQIPKQIPESIHMAKVMPAPSQPEPVKVDKTPNKPGIVSDVKPYSLGMSLVNLALKWIVLLVSFLPLVTLVSTLLNRDDIPTSVAVVVLLIGFLAIAAIFSYIDNVTGISKKK